VGKTLLATTTMARVFDFSMGSTFRAIGQSPTRNALVSEIRRDCKGLPPWIAATEAMYLIMRRAFDELGYRRYAWQCNSLNATSRAAAIRLGFTFEGIWRQADIHKGRNRDTAWFSIVDGEWPAIKTAFERWLPPENFDAEGRQRIRLSELTAAAHRPLDAAKPPGSPWARLPLDRRTNQIRRHFDRSYRPTILAVASVLERSSELTAAPDAVVSSGNCATLTAYTVIS
jgi:hypothetical protein